MSDQPKKPDPGEHPPFMPEVTPELIPVPEVKRDKRVPIDVINGALDEIRRREKNEKGKDDGGGPNTIH